MSYWTRKRQLFYILGILIILLLIAIFFIYKYSHKPPTCFDGVWNGNEEGVDCGGSCPRVCRESVLNLVNWWVRPFEVSPGIYNIVAYFENQNINSGIRDAEYEMQIYDERNIPIGEPLRGSIFVEPNKRSAIFEAGFVSENSTPHTIFINWSSSNVFEVTDSVFLGSLFTIENPRIVNKDSLPRLTADIKNITLSDFNDVWAVAILYNEKGNAIATSQTFIGNLPRESATEVIFVWNEPFAEKVNKIEIIPRVNPFSGA